MYAEASRRESLASKLQSTGSFGRSVVAAVGNTPLVLLSRVLPDAHFRLFAKLEALNPGGSVKDRPALAMIQAAIESGAITSHSTIVESSSGNMAIGLAQVCGLLDLPLICVVDRKISPQNERILRAYGARLERVEQPDPATGEYLHARLQRVKHLLETIPGAFWPNQYASVHNARAHHRTVGEVVAALHGCVDYLFCGTSSCGTLRGCVDYLRTHGMSTKVVAVDAVGSVLFPGSRAKRLLPGLGTAVVPSLFSGDLADDVVHVSDLDSVAGCRRLCRREALLAGASSGGIITAIERFAPKIPKGATCVAILPDRGDRYLDTVYSDTWVQESLGVDLRPGADGARDPGDA